jgi:hypothetical protein
MGGYVLYVIGLTWTWVIAPPVHWALTLSLELQLEFVTLLLIVTFYRPLLVAFVVGRERFCTWREEQQLLREWNFYASMTESAFRTRIDSLRRQADDHDNLAERLERRAEGKYRSGVTRTAATRHQMQAEAIRVEMERIENLWRQIEVARKKEEAEPPVRDKILRLMRRLAGLDEGAAAKALSELNRISSTFEWIGLSAKAMPNEKKTRLVQLLRLMSSTTSVGEARNAYMCAFNMMKEGGWAHLWENVK